MSCACIWLVKVVTLKGSLLFFISPPVQLKPGASAPSPDLPVDSIDVSLRLCVHDAGFICFPLPFQSKVSSPGSSLPPAVSVQLYTIIVEAKSIELFRHYFSIIFQGICMKFGVAIAPNSGCFVLPLGR